MRLTNKTQNLLAWQPDFKIQVESEAHILYNDQPPNAPYIADKGHTKGVIWADSDGGFWLVHSVPHFPMLPTYQYPETGTKFGQSFLCLSLDFSNLNSAAIQLQYNQIHIYSRNIPQILKPKIIEIANAANNSIVKQPPWFRQTIIQTKNGIGFTSFAKSSQFGKELYEDLVAPALETDLFVETWPNGVGKLPSNCSKPYK